jgi:hypothetical protein
MYFTFVCCDREYYITDQNNRQPLSKRAIQKLSNWLIPPLAEWAIQSLSKWSISPWSKWAFPRPTKVVIYTDRRICSILWSDKNK